MNSDVVDGLLNTVCGILGERTWRNLDTTISLKIGNVKIEIGEEVTTIEDYSKVEVPTSKFIGSFQFAYRAIRSTEEQTKYSMSKEDGVKIL